MSHNYTDLLKVAYEIEGLIALQAQRDDDAIATVDEMIADKIAVLAREFGVDKPVAEDIVPEDTVSEDTVSEDDEAIAESVLGEETGDADVISDAAPAPASTPATGSDPASVPARAAAPVPDMSITLDEKLARERAQDIFKAFTLNDKFRFRRELFRDSQEEFDDALNIISQMSTIGEAQEYIYDDLCWDPENEDVKAFMDIVTKHF